MTDKMFTQTINYKKRVEEMLNKTLIDEKEKNLIREQLKMNVSEEITETIKYHIVSQKVFLNRKKQFMDKGLVMATFAELILFNPSILTRAYYSVKKVGILKTHKKTSTLEVDLYPILNFNLNGKRSVDFHDAIIFDMDKVDLLLRETTLHKQTIITDKLDKILSKQKHEKEVFSVPVFA